MKKHLLLSLALAGAVHAADIQGAWLHEHISPDLYLRVPHQWTLLLANGGKDPADLHTHWQAVQNKLALLPGSDPSLSPEEKAVLDTFFAHNSGAIEIAGYIHQSRQPQMLLAGQFAFRDDARFLEFVKTLAAALQLEHQGNGATGTLRKAGDPMQIAYRYDAASGKHQWLFSEQIDGKDDFSPFIGTPGESLQAAAAQIDPQGMGFMVWARNNPILLRSASDEYSPWVKALQLLKMKSFSWGYGMDGDGRPALQFNMEIASGGLRDFFPMQPPITDIAVHGTLESAYAFTFPDSAAVQKILRIIEQGSGERDLYTQIKTQLRQSLNIDADLLFDALGTQWLVINDDFGQVYAIRKTEHWQKGLDMLVEAGLLTLTPDEKSGITHARLSFAQIYKAQTGADDTLQNPILRAILEIPTHFYYREEGDYYLIAELPQPLADRKRTTGGSRIGTHLGTIADTDNSFFGILTIDHLARRHYYSRLHWLQILADIAKTDIDIASLPSAQMLNLPENGQIHAQLMGDTDNIRLKLTFENSLLDPLQHGGIYNHTAAAFTVGILSAIALPAYQDYVERSKQAALEREAEAERLAQLEIFNRLNAREKADITALIERIYNDSNPVRAQYAQKQNENLEAGLEALKEKLPEVEGMYFSEQFMHIKLGGQAPALLQGKWLEFELDEGKWHCGFYDSEEPAQALLPAVCAPKE